MIRFILLRHGETTWNLIGRYQGQMDTPLSERGIEQGKCVARALRDIKIDAFYSSPLSRAYDTCKFCAEAHDPAVPESEIVIDERFSEINHGEWEGNLADDIAKSYSREYELWHTHPDQVRMPGPGGESLADVQARVMSAMGEIIARYKDSCDKCDKTILIVSHDAVNKAILCAITGLPLSNFWSFKQDNTSLNVIECMDSSYYNTPVAWRVSLLNSTAHMGYIYSGIEQKGI